MLRYLRPSILSLAAVLVAFSASALLARSASAQRPPSISILVEASRGEWLDTAIDLAANETAHITATGRAGWEPGVEVGPSGGGESTCVLNAPNLPVGAILLRVGRAQPIAVGEAVDVRGPGRIQLLYNDCPNKYFDNSGAFELTFSFTAAVATQSPARQPTVEAVATAEPAVTAEVANPVPVTAPAVQAKDDGRRFDPAFLVLFLVVVGAGAGFFYGRRYLPSDLIDRVKQRFSRGDVALFSAASRLESSAWLAPVQLREAQGEKRPLRWLNIGGPGNDVDFGLPGVWARLHPTPDGGARFEATPGSGRILIDGLPLTLGQRLESGARVFMGTREFVYRNDADDSSPRISALNRTGAANLDHPDPRAAALG